MERKIGNDSNKIKRNKMERLDDTVTIESEYSYKI
jgi:hypothetical protein